MNMISFNIEGYNRNKFYLSQLLRKYKCIFIFLQEHWLPNYEAVNKFKEDFPVYNFHSTSSDMFLPTEDILLQSGPTWHGTVIGWHNSVDSSIMKLPIISERFCGVKYDDKITKILAYTVYLPTSGQDDEFLEILMQLTMDIINNIEHKDNYAIVIGLDSNQSKKSTLRRTRAMELFMSEFCLRTILPNDARTFHHNNQVSESQIDHILYFIPDWNKNI